MVEIAGVVLRSSRAVKIKEHLPFCGTFRIACIKDRVVVDRDLYIVW